MVLFLSLFVLEITSPSVSANAVAIQFVPGRVRRWYVLALSSISFHPLFVCFFPFINSTSASIIQYPLKPALFDIAVYSSRVFSELPTMFIPTFRVGAHVSRFIRFDLLLSNDTHLHQDNSNHGIYFAASTTILTYFTSGPVLSMVPLRHPGVDSVAVPLRRLLSRLA